MHDLKIISRITEIPASEWDACAGSDDPFVSHAFLAALEDSGSVGGRSGWLPRHLILTDKAGRLAGAVPLYVKAHSWGEYVFDHAWAQAYERAGGRYYPKLLAAVPFTPVTGPRLLVRPTDQGESAMERALIEGMVEQARGSGVSSLHVNFLPADQARRFCEAGFLERTGQQFHWHNPGYAGFEDFLATLSSRKRKMIRKERREAQDLGLTLSTLVGEDITPRHWDAFFQFYENTVDRKWGQAYLTRDFFRRIGRTMGDRVVLVVAESEGVPVAGALNLRGRDTLYGRNWGSAGDYPFLHFEACYYRAMDFAIAEGLARVEAGAQGEHKLLRGYLPTPTYSVHWFRDPAMHRAVEGYLEQERRQVAAQMAHLAEFAPYRQE